MESIPPKKKRSVKKTILRIIAVLLILIITAAVIVYYNFNRILKEALLKSFNANLVSDVYELKFDKLSVNFLLGDIKVYDVSLQPREKPLQNYPYINSALWLHTKKMTLKNVEISTLIRENRLLLEQIEIKEPDVRFRIEDRVPVFFPFKDTVAGQVKKGSKRSVESFFLKEFDMIDASFEVNNLAREREFKIRKINLSLDNILINQLAGMDKISYKNFTFSIGEFAGSLTKPPIKSVSFKDFSIKIDSLEVVHTVDTVIYRWSDFYTGLKSLDIQTTDSIYHLTMGSFDLSYKDRSIKLKDVSFKPNVSDAVIQSMFKYQHTSIAADFGSLSLNNVDFNSLIYNRKLLIDEIVLDKVSAMIYKDNSKPVDFNRVPTYFGQQIAGIPLPLRIKQVKATNVNLVNTERKPDGGLAKANINRGTVTVNNITNMSSDRPLEMNADAYIENKAHAKLTLTFSYTEPQFGMKGRIDQFALAGLNRIIQAYTPARILKGTADEITFSGIVYRTYSTGTMKFLYHDLEVDLNLPDQAKWKSSVLAFAANTAVNTSNPLTDLPPRIVNYKAERNMNKGFVNIMIRSVLAGLKETMIMSKENRKAYKEVKKAHKKEQKEIKKAEKKEKRRLKKEQKKAKNSNACAKMLSINILS